jgi:2-polyprenyl-3-methyl-5-hydroxy-6-metoxy-1,4-benzoquinol methylase
VLDLGCSSGLPLSPVPIDEGLTVYAIDASPTLVAAFRQQFPDVAVACESVEESSFFGRQFDAVLAWGLLFLLSEATQLDLLERVACALNPGGRLLLTALREYDDEGENHYCDVVKASSASSEVSR